MSTLLYTLGCDKKVLVTRDPTKSLMSAYVTGGKGGGGAVFSLAVKEVCPLRSLQFGVVN